MLITRETDYAIRCVLYLARERDKVASVTEIAKAMHIPKSFLAKILQRLVKTGIARSIRGARGGFMLYRSPTQISLMDVIKAVQGAAEINVCAVDAGRCRLSRTCAVHPVWVEIRREIEARLKGVSLARLLGLRFLG